MDYTVWTSGPESDFTQPVFSVILITYGHNLPFIQSSVESVLSQSYPNTELILILNGVAPPVESWIRDRLAEESLITVLSLKEGHYDPLKPDLENPIPTLWNAGLLASRGNFVYFLSYDDYLSVDYVDRMVGLFNSCPTCVSAAPGVVIVDEGGTAIDTREHLFSGIRATNRYLGGVELVRGVMRGSVEFTAPGGVLAHRATAVLEAGGFDVANDLTQLFKIGIQGDIGIDSEATIYWRRHGGQANRIQKDLGLVYYRDLTRLMSTYGMDARLEQLGGPDLAREVDRYIYRNAEQTADTSLRDSSRDYGLLPGLRAAQNIIRECPPRTAWKLIAKNLYNIPLGLIKRHSGGWYACVKLRLRRNSSSHVDDDSSR